MHSPVGESQSNRLFEKETLDYIQDQINGFKPKVGIILGTGLGGLVRDVDIEHKLDYKLIPHFPVSTVESHQGYLIFGRLSSHNAVIMQGRFHFYEGYSVKQITYPIKIMRELGIKTLLVSNACGAVNPLFKKGDLMIMKDHINYLFDTPLKGYRLNIRNKKIYDDSLIKLAWQTAMKNNISVCQGIYCSLRGPTLETKAEYRMIRKMGADVVGMSTIPEALVSSAGDMSVLGFSIVTDVGFPDSLKPATLKEILEIAAEAEPNLTLLMKKIVEKI